MKKNSKGQLLLIIGLLACAVVLFGTAIAVAFSDRGNGKDDKPQNSIVDSTDDDEWTQNY